MSARAAVRDAQLVQARPSLQLPITAGEGNMIRPVRCSSTFTCGLRVVRASRAAPAAEREYGVVKSSGLLVLVENGPGAQQPVVPASASLQISHRERDGRSAGTQAQRLLTDGATRVITKIARQAPAGGTPA
jgi:hypothetical protein